MAHERDELQDLRDSNARMADLLDAIRARLGLDEGVSITDALGVLINAIDAMTKANKEIAHAMGEIKETLEAS